MPLDKSILAQTPTVMRDFLFYMETIKGRSPRTVDSYFIDLRTFFRFLKLHRDLVAADVPFDDIPIDDVDIDFIRSVTLSDVYEFMYFITKERGNSATTRARKVSCLKSFFKYLTVNANLLEQNPIKDLEIPAIKKSMPKYLTLEESLELLNHVVDDGYYERDFCMLTLFLNCGMRLSELVGIDLGDLSDNTVRITGKGNKERIVYLNQACLDAIENYKPVRSRNLTDIKDRDALFLSRLGTRISRRRVQQIVERTLQNAGLSNQGLSTHKLRHTAATLMYQYGGVDIRVLSEILGHEHVSTTEIYTHVSNKQMEEASAKSPLSGVKPPKRKTAPKIKPQKDDNKEQK